MRNAPKMLTEGHPQAAYTAAAQHAHCSAPPVVPSTPLDRGETQLTPALRLAWRRCRAADPTLCSRRSPTRRYDGGTAAGGRMLLSSGEANK